MATEPKAHREICALCGEVNRVGFHVPDNIWAAVVHVSRLHDIHCLRCFTRRADEKQVEWDRDIAFYAVSWVTHTKEPAIVGERSVHTPDLPCTNSPGASEESAKSVATRLPGIRVESAAVRGETPDAHVALIPRSAGIDGGWIGRCSCGWSGYTMKFYDHALDETRLHFRATPSTPAGSKEGEA